MSDPILWFARHRIAANLLMVAIVAGGLLTLPTITREVFPDITPDLVTVSVAYPGASPNEVETLIVQRIEERIEGLVGVRRVTSTASEGGAQIVIELLADADPQRLLENVKTRVDAITTLPKEAEEPIVERPLIRRQVISVAVSGRVAERLLKQTADRVRDEIASLPGITNAEVTGVRSDEISISVSEEALYRHQLTFDDVASAVRRASLDLPGGVLKTDGGEIRLRTFGQARTRSEFERIALLTRPDGTRLTLGEVAHIEDGFEETDRQVRFDGEPAALVRVYRVGDQSALDISAAVQEYVAQTPVPAGVSLETWDDDARVLRGRLDTLLRNAGSGLLLVLACLALFLKPRLAFWVAAGIPVAFLGALWVMPSASVSLNVVSLFAFILVLGVLVDDSIVVGENVHQRQSEPGADPLQAAVEGTREVAVPVTFGVLTTVVAFSPLLFVEGAASVIWRQIPVVVITALLFSLVKCYFVLPAHLGHPGSSRWRMPRQLAVLTRVQERVAGALERFVERRYRPFLEQVLHARYLTLAVAFACVMVCAGAVFGGWVRFSFFPPVEGDQVVASFDLSPGAPFEQVQETVRQLEDSATRLRAQLEAEPDGRSAIENVLASAGQRLGRARGRTSVDAGSGSNTGSVEIALSSASDRSISAREVVRRWRELTGTMPDVEELTFSSDLFSAGDPIDIELRGADVAMLRGAATRLREDLELRPGVRDVRDSYQSAKDELELRLRPEAEGLGVSVVDLARQVRQAFYGEEAQRVARNGEDVKVMVRYPLADRRSLGDVEDLRIRTPDGEAIPLSVVAQVVMGDGPAAIRRADGARVVNVRADVDASVTSAQQVLDDLRAGPLPALLRATPGVAYSLEGEQREQRESLSGLGRGFVFALIGIFILLAVPLRSYGQPLLVMSTIPLGAVGAVVGHAWLGLPLSFSSVIGMVALAGVVVNDSLVLVDWANRSARKGRDPRSAAIEAAVSRFRPIFLTSLTTCLGLTPLLLERSVQAQFLIPMAVSITAGILAATLVSLLVVPAAYLVLDDLKAWRGLGAAVDGRFAGVSAGSH